MKADGTRHVLPVLSLILTGASPWSAPLRIHHKPSLQMQLCMRVSLCLYQSSIYPTLPSSLSRPSISLPVYLCLYVCGERDCEEMYTCSYPCRVEHSDADLFFLAVLKKRSRDIHIQGCLRMQGA